MGFFNKIQSNLDYKENLKKKIAYLDKYCPKCYIHVSNHKLTIESIKNYDSKEESWLKSSTYNNPQGLWIGIGSSWLKFVDSYGSYDSSWAKAKYMYKIILGKKVLIIHNLKNLIKFHKEFAKYNKDIGYKINWLKVKQKYNGLIINPYLGEKIWGNDRQVLNYYLSEPNNEHIRKALGRNITKYPMLYLEWYRHWETASGVIWKKDGISDIEKVPL